MASNENSALNTEILLMIVRSERIDILMEGGKYDEALQLIKNELVRFPVDTEYTMQVSALYRKLAECYTRMGRHDEAKEAMNKALGV